MKFEPAKKLPQNKNYIFKLRILKRITFFFSESELYKHFQEKKPEAVEPDRVGVRNFFENFGGHGEV